MHIWDTKCDSIAIILDNAIEITYRINTKINSNIAPAIFYLCPHIQKIIKVSICIVSFEMNVFLFIDIT
jgi:hypothetical protein